MALRYEYPGDSFTPISSDLECLPAMRDPIDAVFNGKADTEDFLAQIEGRPYCRVKGHTGVGKTSILPKLIALHTRRLVLVVTAHPLLAHSGYDFYRTNKQHGVDGSELRACHMVDNDIDMDDYDLIWVSAARLVAWMIARKGKGDVTHILADAVVFLDEAHEADAYTHVIRTVIPQCGASTLLLVSATFDPQGHDISHNKNVQVKTYDKSDETKFWDVTKVGKPWSYNMIKGGAILFVDKEFDADRLACQYRSVGYIAHRLTARSKISEYTRATEQLNDPRAPPVVLLLDSSYRSGFNFDVDLIIDTGVRYIPTGDTGDFSYTKRFIYNTEFVQSAGRGGRFGRRTVYYMPNIEPEWKICDLEPVEREAAALLTRAFGYSPNRETAASVMAYDDLPSGLDIVAVLNGPTPLSCFVRDKSGNRKPETREVKVRIPTPKAVSHTSRSTKHKSASDTDKSDSGVRNTTAETVISDRTTTTHLTNQTLMRLNSQYKSSPLAKQAEDCSAVVGNSSRYDRASGHVGGIKPGKTGTKSRRKSRCDTLRHSERSVLSDDISASSTVTRLTTSSLRRLEAEYANDKRRTPAVPLSRPPTDIVRANVKSTNGLSPTELDYLDHRTISIAPRDSVSRLDALTQYTDAKDNLTVRFDDPLKPVLRKESNSNKAMTTATDVVHKSIDEIWQQMLNKSSTRDTIPVKCGTYLHSPDIVTNKVIPYSRYFPKGEKSVLELLNDGELLRIASTLDREHLKFALYHALRRYNTMNMQVNSVKRAVAEMLNKDVRISTPSQMKHTFENVTQTVALWEIERDSYFSAILGLAADNFLIEHIDGIYSHELKLTARYRKIFNNRMMSDIKVNSPVITDWVDKDNLLQTDPYIGDIVPHKEKKKEKSKDKESVKVVYIKPSIGISTLTVNTDDTVDVKPTRIMRHITGVDKFTISGVELRHKRHHK